MSYITPRVQSGRGNFAAAVDKVSNVAYRRDRGARRSSESSSCLLSLNLRVQDTRYPSWPSCANAERSASLARARDTRAAL